MSFTLCGLHEYVSHYNMITTAILITSFANHYLVFPEERCQPLSSAALSQVKTVCTLPAPFSRVTEYSPK